jgi:transcriptional regulator with XRE-family HTH domain
MDTLETLCHFGHMNTTSRLPSSRSAYLLRGNRVRALLGRRNLTITEGAEKLGVSRSYFSQLLAGRRTLSPKVRRRLLSHAPFSELSADDLWRAPPEEAEEVAHGG